MIIQMSKMTEGESFYLNFAASEFHKEGTFPHVHLKDCAESAQEWATLDDEEWLVLECKIVKRVKP